MLPGLLYYAAIWIGTALFLSAVLYAGAVVEGVRRLGRSLHVIAPPDPLVGEPIERIAADIRRLGRAVSRLPAGCPMVRRRATMAAYDDALVDACGALEIATQLRDLPDGLARDVERMRVESDLRCAGLVMDDVA